MYFFMDSCTPLKEENMKSTKSTYENTKSTKSTYESTKSTKSTYLDVQYDYLNNL